MREAFARLETDGLVELHGRHGIVVAETEVRPACSTRTRPDLCSKPPAAGKAAGAATNGLIADLRNILYREASTDDESVIFETSRQFHQTIVAAVGNPYLDRLFRLDMDFQLYTAFVPAARLALTLAVMIIKSTRPSGRRS